MNKKLPFEDAIERQMNNLAPSQEDESWQKMKQLLDENDKRRPGVFFKTYKATGVLVLMLMVCLYLIIPYLNGSKQRSAATLKNDAVPEKETIAAQPSAKKLSETKTSNQNISAAMRGSTKKKKDFEDKINAKANNKSIATSATEVAESKKSNPIAKSVISGIKRQKAFLQPGSKILPRKTDVAGTNTGKAAEINDINSHEKIGAGTMEENRNIDTTSVTAPDQQSQRVPADSLSQLKGVASKDSAEEENEFGRPPAYIVTGGIAIQQQIPIAGQQSIRYGYNGSNAITDYIPSVYFRLEKEQKWFLQGEFSYRAPQLVKEFGYSRQTRADSSGAYTTTTLRLKKTFYSQLPVSFNYYFRPNWSVGIGGMYSWFHGAIIEKETMKQNVQTQVKSVAKEIVPITGYNDSFLYKSHTYLLLQSDYHWRRLSLGLRYTKDMEPYIRYTLPDGTIAGKKNWSLEFVVRFRLWKSERF